MRNTFPSSFRLKNLVQSQRVPLCVYRKQCVQPYLCLRLPIWNHFPWPRERLTSIGSFFAKACASQADTFNDLEEAQESVHWTVAVQCLPIHACIMREI